MRQGLECVLSLKPRLHMDAGHDNAPVVELVRYAALFEPIGLMLLAGVAGELVEFSRIEVFGHLIPQKKSRSMAADVKSVCWWWIVVVPLR